MYNFDTHHVIKTVFYFIFALEYSCIKSCYYFCIFIFPFSHVFFISLFSFFCVLYIFLFLCYHTNPLLQPSCSQWWLGAELVVTAGCSAAWGEPAACSNACSCSSSGVTQRQENGNQSNSRRSSSSRNSPGTTCTLSTNQIPGRCSHLESGAYCSSGEHNIYSHGQKESIFFTVI